jgi:hypothetical protein
MFEFFQDMSNYNDRKVDRHEFDWGFVSTVRVSDGAQPFETAVEHARYHDGKMIIVEAYDDTELAQKGHNEWVEKMDGNLPAAISECSNSEIQRMCDGFENGGKPPTFMLQEESK